MFSLDTPPRKAAKMHRRPSIQIDVDFAYSLPPAPARRWPTEGRTHTIYMNYVNTLRGRGDAIEALAHFQQTGKYLDQGLGVVERRKKEKLAEPRTHEPEADPGDYSNMFEEDLSGSFGDMTMGDYGSEQNKLVQQVHASTPQGTTPFLKSIIERYPCPNEIVKERTNEYYKALVSMTCRRRRSRCFCRGRESVIRKGGFHTLPQGILWDVISSAEGGYGHCKRTLRSLEIGGQTRMLPQVH